MAVDFIGDVHGHADELEALLKGLGYAERGGCYRHVHPDRHAVFLGDYIDRGPQQLRSVDVVRRMRDAGVATALMGNHEHNAIGWFREDPDRPGHHLRVHGSKNRAQHGAFLAQVGEGSPLHRELIEWMETLPLAWSFRGARAVHACWHPGKLAAVAGHASRHGSLTENALVASFRKGSQIRDAVEILTKGIEADLPDGIRFRDKDGHLRTKTRLRWWDATAKTIAEASVGEDWEGGEPTVPLPAEVSVAPSRVDGPVFFGHYWMTGEPKLLAPNAACLDFSVAKAGHVCAYTWTGERVLDPAALSWVPSRDRLPAAGMPGP